MLNKILSQLNIESQYVKLLKALEQNKSSSVFGAGVGDKTLFLNDIKKPILFIASTVKEANIIKEQMLSLNKKVSTIYYKLNGYIYHSAEQNYTMLEYYHTLFNLINNNSEVVIITPEVLMQKLPNKQVFKEHILSLKKGVCYEPNSLVKHLIKIGYNRVSRVEEKGQFSLRGDILDVFAINNPLPFRVQFFDDEIEEIKTFNLASYTTINNEERFDISPNTLIFIEQNGLESFKKDLLSQVDKTKLEPDYKVRLNNIAEKVLLDLDFGSREVSLAWCLPFIKNYSESLLSYFNEEPLIVFDGTRQIVNELDLLYKEFKTSMQTLSTAGEVMLKHKKFYFNKTEVLNSLVSFTKLAFQSITMANNLFNPEAVFSIKSAPVINYSKNFSLLANDLKRFIVQNKTVILASDNSSSSVYIEKYLKEQKISCKLITNVSQIQTIGVYILTKKINMGCNLTLENLVIIGSENLFSKKSTKVLKKRNSKNAFTMPKVNEYIVHDTHGVGLCMGIKRLKFVGYEKDYILIKYAGNSLLYLPTEQVELISSFVGGEEAPKLNKIGGAEFFKAKERVKKSVKEMAVNLLELYAEREKTTGHKFLEDDLLQQEFERAFPHTETEDQLTAINDIKKDMESSKVMDRLICGDVGYGKTEVALRAIFKAIVSGKQVAFLAPTTILVQQHYNTCVTRMSDFMVNCDVISRFKTPKEIKLSLQKLKEGKTNVVCGTHRLLSKDVEFNDLGLLILDEEQRFGVADKEKIKEIKKDIDVISMSATPIPRTLHMSMVGIRDISLIETPPKNRLPVQTFVTEYSNALLKDAVNREILRGGQVLVVSNRVDTIYSVYSKLQNLLPDVVMDVAHGQMNRKELENVINNLYSGKIQLILATTLIENGIDLPNANTLIILNSDKLGLSQLYQLRGRVGRSDRLGYAYFTYSKQKVLTETAFKRLQAINEFTELGSGFKIALRDLEIRGAGNILGKEQHGQMGKVGYDMYCKILAESVAELKGEQKKKQREIKLDIALSAYIPTSYISEDENRFRVYSSLSVIESKEQKEKTLNEIEDIYGIVPQAVINLANIAFIKNLGLKLDVKRITIKDNKCEVELYDKKMAVSQKISRAISSGKGIAVLKFKETPIIEFNFNKYNMLKKQELLIKFLVLCCRI